MFNNSMNLSILIATKDREKNLLKLLSSLANSVKHPYEVIIVSSGVKLGHTLKKYNSILNIKYMHVEIKSQVHQKKMGIKNVAKNSDWVMFCDDDLEFLPDTISNIIQVCSDSNNDIGGIGFNVILNPISQNKISWRLRFLRKPGKLRKNGVTNNYLGTHKKIETMWLNGASLWRAQIVGQYNPRLPRPEYAAYEDVFFSYNVGRFKKLIYDPKLRLLSQPEANINQSHFVNFRALTLNRIAFVKKYKEFSTFNLYIYEFLRLLKIILSNTPEKKSKVQFLIKILLSFNKF